MKSNHNHQHSNTKSRRKKKKKKKGTFVKKLQIFFFTTLTISLLTSLYYWNKVIMDAQMKKPQALFGSLGDNNGGGDEYTGVLEGGGGNDVSESMNIEKTSHTNQDNNKTKDNHNNNKKEQHHQLPEWITNYLKWHHEIRTKYPDKTLLTDPTAPKLLVRICLGLCGGLHDRLGQLPMDLYIANQTQRVLLIKWVKPHALESFLVPPKQKKKKNGGGEFYLDWTFPEGVEGWGSTGCRTLNECAKQVRAQPSLASNVGGDRADITSFDSFLSERLEDLNSGQFKDTKAVTFNFVHIYEEKDAMDKRLTELGETDLLYHTPSFGLIFHSFFEPHPDVQKEIDGVYNDLKIVPGGYDAVHCRVRHPRAYAQGATFKTKDGDEQYIANADKVGMPFEGEFRNAMIQTAIHAVQCAATLPNAVVVGGEKNPIYFMSDSSDLVHYMTHDLYNEEYRKNNTKSFQNQESFDAKAASLTSTTKLIAREQSIPNAHIDKNKGRQRHEYFGTFVDLYLAMNAKCISYGIGNFATFAARISGTTCVVKHQEEKWGVVTRFDKAQICSLD